MVDDTFCVPKHSEHHFLGCMLNPGLGVMAFPCFQPSCTGLFHAGLIEMEPRLIHGDEGGGKSWFSSEDAEDVAGKADSFVALQIGELMWTPDAGPFLHLQLSLQGAVNCGHTQSMLVCQLSQSLVGHGPDTVSDQPQDLGCQLGWSSCWFWCRQVTNPAAELSHPMVNTRHTEGVVAMHSSQMTGNLTRSHS